MDEKLSYDDVNILPKYSEISSRDNVDISTEICGHELDIPVIAAPMESVMGMDMHVALTNHGANGIFHRFNGNTQYRDLRWCRENKGELIPATGIHPSEYRLGVYNSYGVNTILIDVAHGHHQYVKETLEFIKNNFDFNIIAGTVATPEAAVDLVKWGADCLRVGIGAGSCCTTREKTGVGVPMISCIRKIAEEVETRNRELHQVRDNPITVIADGGIKSAGDICKALAAGADAVMAGSLFAGTNEAPGEIIEVDGKKMKKYYGSASFEQKGEQNYVEGVSSLVPYKGSVVDILKDIKDGIRSSFSYVGASNLEEFHENAELIKVSQNGHKRGKAHI